MSEMPGPGKITFVPFDEQRYRRNLAEYERMTEGTNPKDACGDKKPDLSLIPPVALLAEARVFQLGANKYGPYNWREKNVRARVYTAAAMRHILAWQDGTDLDEESGESHLAHARACLGILLDSLNLGKLADDRAVVGVGNVSPAGK